MNYKKIHDNIINKAIFEKRSRKNNHYEKHHIIPRSLGGLNIRQNLVLLTPKEHFIIHKLLTEIYPKNPKLWWAYWQMSNKCANKYHKRYYRIPSKEYERIKLNLKISEETKQKIRNARKNQIFTQESYEKLRKHYLGKSFEERYGKEKALDMIKVRKQKTKEQWNNRTEEQKQSIINNLYSNLIPYICPHCGKKGTGRVMKRWHFENCKQLKK